MPKRPSRRAPKKKVPSPVRHARAIKPATRILLAVAAGGRCEFPGCNDYLFEHPLTLRTGNFSEYAHVVAFSEQGPRGKDKKRPRDIHGIDNLMLLCQRDHKHIDDNPEQFPRVVLEKYKEEHETRIRHVTSLRPDKQTSVVQFKALIGGDAVEIPPTQIYEALAPRYPTDKHGHTI